MTQPGRGIPGTSVRLSYDMGRDYTGPWPEPGDFLRSTAGACYLVDGVRHSRSIAGRVYLRCTRLGRDAVGPNDSGVWPIYWYSRLRRRAA